VLTISDRSPIAVAYRDLAGRLPAIAAGAPLTFCGMSACVDATINMGEMTALIEATEPPGAVAFANMLKGRAARGIGGEVRVEWPEGPAWLAERLRPRYSLGGTGPHASWVLSTLRAPAVLNLGDRSEHMLSHLPERVLLAQGDALLPAAQVKRRGVRRPNIFIFEYTAGVPVGDVMPTRSTRIIVRFDDPGLEHDDDFEAASVRAGADAGSGLVAGFGAISLAELPGELDRVFGLTRRWHAAGMPHIHLEMSGIDTPRQRDLMLEAAAEGRLSSIGMSQSELVDIYPESADTALLPRKMAELGDRLHLRRVCVHADHWAASVTLDDPEIERDALMAGCLLSSCRASEGRPVVPSGPPAKAEFGTPPFAADARVGKWRVVAVPSPYLARPVTTLGLGDTFTAGCLLVLGATSAAAGREREEA
jgi:ADP-dependent phosphofructokinase/glucokinase